MEKQKIRMVVFDWAGTTVDYGSMAPLDVFEEVFRNAKIPLSLDELNGPMGMEKREHIRTLLGSEHARRLWKNEYGRDWTEEDVDALYARFKERLLEVVADYSTPIPGTAETVKELRNAGIRIGSTTGYNAQMMSRVAPKAASLGYEPDCIVTPDDTGKGRPAPYMMFACMQKLSVYPPCAVVKVGDTVLDMQEGKNAGAWCIGVLEGSSMMALRKEEYDALSDEEKKKRKETAASRYRAAGADAVIESIRDLPRAVEELNRRIEEAAI